MPEQECAANRVSAAARASTGTTFGEPFLTQDPRTFRALRILERVAPTNATVLIHGESGTGKELLAQALHQSSLRAHRPFVAVNCGAVADGLAESEFFGHVRGAFTGAGERKAGWFEAAEGGTIFLDEVGEMKPSLQVSLLRILQSGEYAPVGAGQNTTCDVRVVSASNRTLERLVAEGSFRRDLLYRLNVISVELPPLRERRGDVPLLVRTFVERFSERYDRQGLEVAPSFLAALQRHPFEGNVRELENLVCRAVLLCESDTLGEEHLSGLLAQEPVEATEELPYHDAKLRAMEAFDRGYITAALRRSGGIVRRAADQCGLSERNFHVKLKALGFSALDFRA